MSQPSTVGVVVINWNGAAQSRLCLRSLLAVAYPAVRILLIDNGSADGSGATLAREFPAVEVLALPENRGYAGACNAGIGWARRSGMRYVWLLNNDTAVEAGALSALVSAAERTGAPAILAPTILTGGEAERIWSAGGVVRWPWLEREHIAAGAPAGAGPAAGPVAWASGCSLFFPLDVADRVGPMDERYFLYLEDVDWCLTARRRGISVWLVPEARVWHAVSRSTRSLDPRVLRYYACRNYFLLAARHCGPVGRAWVAGRLVVTLAKIGLRSALFPSYRRDSYYHAQTRGLLDFLRGRHGIAPYPHRPLPAAPEHHSERVTAT